MFTSSHWCHLSNAPARELRNRLVVGSMAAGRINHNIAVDDEGSTDGCEIDDYKPDVAEHPATSSHDEAG